MRPLEILYPILENNFYLYYISKIGVNLQNKTIQLWQILEI